MHTEKAYTKATENEKYKNINKDEAVDVMALLWRHLACNFELNNFRQRCACLQTIKHQHNNYYQL